MRPFFPRARGTGPIHEPHFSDAEFVVGGLPPLEECLCTLSPCPRCEQGRGGFRFPWLGIWTRRSVLAQPGASPAEVWSGYHANLERLDLLLLAPLASGRVRADVLRNHWTCATIGPGATQSSEPRRTVQNAFEGFLQQRGRSFPPESGISASQAWPGGGDGAQHGQSSGGSSRCLRLARNAGLRFWAAGWSCDAGGECSATSM